MTVKEPIKIFRTNLADLSPDLRRGLRSLDKEKTSVRVALKLNEFISPKSLQMVDAHNIRNMGITDEHAVFAPESGKLRTVPAGFFGGPVFAFKVGDLGVVLVREMESGHLKRLVAATRRVQIVKALKAKRR